MKRPDPIGRRGSCKMTSILDWAYVNGMKCWLKVQEYCKSPKNQIGELFEIWITSRFHYIYNDKGQRADSLWLNKKNIFSWVVAVAVSLSLPSILMVGESSDPTVDGRRCLPMCSPEAGLWRGEKTHVQRCCVLLSHQAISISGIFQRWTPQKWPKFIHPGGHGFLKISDFPVRSFKLVVQKSRCFCPLMIWIKMIKLSFLPGFDIMYV